ncbi:MAG: 5-formyltetrahydrofolate cyclo-ligase [Promethearchaeota archaeon CR_4]|nr:MAG: 5-formyltetrahydrofolate cyclo-ligase [Candidatus Lokiarchaeota archaeon CR_4]
MLTNENLLREKQRIRELVRSRKTTLGANLDLLSDRVTRNLETLPFIPRDKGSSLIYFVGKRQTYEVQTLPHIRTLLDQGLEVWLPKTIIATKSLRWGNVRDLRADLAVGAFSVLEPTIEVIAREAVDFKTIQLVVIPGVAFDEQGHRLGYGQGYYDRFLQSTPIICPVVGLAFDFQVFPELPNEIHDAKMDYLITEKKVWTFRKKI